MYYQNIIHVIMAIQNIYELSSYFLTVNQ